MVASLTPNSRASSFTVRPASTCFSTPMICSSVCLPFFIEAPFLRLLLPELLNYGWRRLSKAGQLLCWPVWRLLVCSPRFTGVRLLRNAWPSPQHRQVLIDQGLSGVAENIVGRETVSRIRSLTGPQVWVLLRLAWRTSPRQSAHWAAPR